MADEYISREAFITRQRELYCQNCDRRRGMKDGKLTKRFVYPIGGTPCRACDVDDMINAVEDYPAADVVPVRHGRWEKATGMMPPEYCGLHICSECGHYAGRKPPYGGREMLSDYCPNCGARMDGDANVQNCEKNHLRPTNMSGTKCEPCKPTQPECGDCEYIKDGDGDA